MKELSIEEKAKAYDDIIERLKDFQFEYRFSPFSDIIGDKFPELKESEDERIRKWIRKELESKYVVDNIVNNVMADKALAWIEKQGEQNLANFAKTCKDEKESTDKVEPKFHEGEWAAINPELRFASPIRINDIHNNNYRVESVDGNSGEPTIDYIDRNYHLWTIQDAKDGDVLYNNSDNTVLIFKSQTCGWIKVYCDFWTNKNKFTGTDSADYGRVSEMDLKPATKEQRDLLFQKMKELGYEWDAENKEPRKIEQKSDSNVLLTWSEEDESMLNFVKVVLSKHQNDELFDMSKTTLNDCLSWFKDIKSRVCYEVNCTTTTKEWSKEDENIVCFLINVIENYRIRNGFSSVLEQGNKAINWLKSIRPQKQWKPTDKQIMALRWVLNHIPYDSHKEEISGLLDQIKDL